jgi:hypothetical protein
MAQGRGSPTTSQGDKA